MTPAATNYHPFTPDESGRYCQCGSKADAPIHVLTPEPSPGTEPTDLELLTGAVARGWCHPENMSKEMDTDLAEAIIDEVLPLLVRARG